MNKGIHDVTFLANVLGYVADISVRWSGKGDKPGHEFHGNQWGEGHGGAAVPSPHRNDAGVEGGIDGFYNTKDKYKDPATGKYTPERQALHDKVVEGILAGHKPSAHPTFLVLGGGTASGKSTMFGGKNAVGAVVDPDQIKAQLPEFQQLLAAGDSPCGWLHGQRKVRHH